MARVDHTWDDESSICMTDEEYWALEPTRCAEEGGVWDAEWEWCDYWADWDWDWDADWVLRGGKPVSLRSEKPSFKFQNMMIDVSKKTAFDRYFRSHMSQAPPQVHAWKASLDKATTKFVRSLKQKGLSLKKDPKTPTIVKKDTVEIPTVTLAAKKSNQKKKTQKKHSNAYAGVAFGVIGTVAAISLIAQFNKKGAQSTVEEALI